MKFLIIGILCLALVGCATSGGKPSALTNFDEQFHKDLLKTAEMRMEYISCDIGLIDGLGVASAAKFPIKNSEEARALLQNPAISLALGEMVQITKDNGKWKQPDYDKCYLVGAGYRVVALSTIDILKLFPQLVPYLAVFAQ